MFCWSMNKAPECHDYFIRLEKKAALLIAPDVHPPVVRSVAVEGRHRSGRSLETLSWWPSHLSATHNVDMEMEHRLSSILAIVDH